MADFIIRGNICYSKNATEIFYGENHCIVVRDDRCQGVYPAAELPTEFRALPTANYGDKLVIPGLVDTHIHAPQYAFRGTGMDMELLDWLNAYTFPEESKYGDMAYAARAYGIFAAHLRAGATTRLCAFGTIHRAATELLMEKLAAAGLAALVGKVNMDRNSPDNLVETTDESLAETELWLRATKDKWPNVKPIITPRFYPSCSDELMAGLGALAKKYGVPVQSHLSENRSEIEWVKSLAPWSRNYAHTYEKYGLFGQTPTVMAHCVWSDAGERAMLKEYGVFVAHSPESNINLISGVAPIGEYLRDGLAVGLATDVAGGSGDNMFRAMACAVYASKMRAALRDEPQAVISPANAFYLATRGGGAFFGQVGAFEPGYEFDALVIDDSALATPRDMTLAERLERLPYLADERHIAAKYVAGKKLFG